LGRWRLGGFRFKAGSTPAPAKIRDPIRKIVKAKQQQQQRAGGMAQVVECLLSKPRVQTLVQSLKKRRKKESLS
jgi:hypothetical protein